MRFEFLTRANVGALHTLCTENKPEFASANAKREQWLDGMFKKGLRGWIAYQDQTPLGYVEYLPIETAPFPVTGHNANFLTCLWVLPVHNHLGVGGSLLAACLGDSPQGVATVVFKGGHMPVEFYEHFGFRVADQIGDSVLLVHGDVEAQLLHTHYRAHESSRQLKVDVMYNPECPWSTRTAERVIEVIEKHPARDEIDLWVGDACACGTHLGIHGGIFLNGMQPFTTPPTEEELARAVENALTIRVPSDT